MLSKNILTKETTKFFDIFVRGPSFSMEGLKLSCKNILHVVAGAAELDGDDGQHQKPSAESIRPVLHPSHKFFAF